VLEFGCGLGDIISRIHAPRRVASDLSGRVLVAAALAHPIEYFLRRLSLRRLALGEPFGETFDVVICVNFLHNIDPDELRTIFDRIFTRLLSPGGTIVFDTVANPRYRFNHDLRNLTGGRPCDVTSVDGFEFGRVIHFVIPRTPDPHPRDEQAGSK
jgi:SAM-dependent methyltransferase